MIAHRLTTIQRCDMIMVMDKGQVKERGSHGDLLQIPIEKSADGSVLSGWYHDLWSAQMGSDDAHELQVLQRRVKLLEAKNTRLMREAFKTRLSAYPRRVSADRTDDPTSSTTPTLLVSRKRKGR